MAIGAEDRVLSNMAGKAVLQADGPDAQSTSVVHAFPSDVIYNADRTLAYIARDDGNITVYDTFTGTVIATWDVGTKLGGMDISADGSFLLVVEKEKVSGSGADDTFAIRKIDTATGAEVGQFTKVFGTFDGPFYDVALFADGTAIVTTTLRGSGATTTYRLDSATGVFTQLVSNSAQAPIVTASADRLSILLTNGFNVSGPNQTYSLTAEGTVALAGSRGVPSSGNSIHAFSADGTLVAVPESGNVAIFDSQLNSVATVTGFSGSTIGGLAFDDHGDFLYVLNVSAKEIVKVSTTSWTAVGTIPFTENLPSFPGYMNNGANLVVGPDAQYFLFISGDDLFRLENTLAIAPVQGNDGGTDTMTGTANADILYGRGGNDALIGLGGDDTLRGGAGNDVLDGGAGHDAMYGGDGDDTYIVDDVRDLAGEASTAGGNDQVLASVSYELAGNIEQLVLLGAAINGTGNAGANTIYGNGADNVLSGMGGDDLLIGGGGNDTLKGGTGIDRFYGGAGNDTFEVDRAEELVFENAGEGVDTVFSSANFYLYANIENLTLTGTATAFGVGNALDNVITGNESANLLIGGGGNDTIDGGIGQDSIYGEDGNDTLYGGPSVDLIVGGAGDDILDGGTGNDRLYGGAGNDTYHVNSSADLVFEDAGGGTDSVIASASAFLYANVENLTFTGTGNFMGAGNDLANRIIGNSGENLITGGGGNDQIEGGAGNDRLWGEAGDDTLFGENGNDLLVGGEGNDRIVGGQGADSIYGEDGDDDLSGGPGVSSTDSDLIVGGAGNDTIHADENSWSDNLYGGTGDDTYYIEGYVYYNGPGFSTRNEAVDLVFEDADGGNDTVYVSTNDPSFDYYMTANVENLFLVGSAQDAVGNASANRMTGNTAGNLLLGGGGNDVLNGKSGNDVLFGEAGADTFVFERGTGGDVIGDFTVGTDKIDLSAFGLTYQAVVNSMHENGGTTAIDLGNGDFIVLNGVAANTLSQSDFILAQAKTSDGGRLANMAMASPIDSTGGSLATDGMQDADTAAWHWLYWRELAAEPSLSI